MNYKIEKKEEKKWNKNSDNWKRTITIINLVIKKIDKMWIICIEIYHISKGIAKKINEKYIIKC